MNLSADSDGTALLMNGSLRVNAPNSALQTARTSASHSVVDMARMDGDSASRHTGESPLRSSSVILPSPSAHSQVSDSSSSMFPGVVHERARRKSIRKGSGSEKDSDCGATTPSRSFTRDRDEISIDDTVREVSDEGDSQ